MTDLLIFADAWLSAEEIHHPALVTRWRFDELEGEFAYDDVSGYRGQLYGNPQWIQEDDPFRRALLFDGVDDYVEITGYKGITGSASRTCAAWISAGMPSLQIINWGSLITGGKWAVRINEDGTLRAEVQSGYIYGKTNIADDEWHHVAVTYSGEDTLNSNSVRLYVDGKLEQVGDVLSQTVNTAAEADVKIGIAITGTSSATGKIDDVRIYNCALSEAEVFNLFETGSAARHNPDFNADGQSNIHDFAQIAHLWNTQEPAVVISEFLASNDADNPPLTEQGQIRDGNGEASDWIELFNQTDFPIDLSGWGLTDDAGNLLQWRFPEGAVIDGRSYLIVFASGRTESTPYVDPAGYLHTNFRLSASGEYLSLVHADGTVMMAYDSVENGFPEQRENISYGMLFGQEYYFSLPTPGQPNRQSFLGFVEAPQFSHERGYYEQSFSLTLTTSTPEAVIRYTTDGTDPTLSNGTTYTGPIPITTSTSSVGRYIRAAAFKAGYQTSPIKTKTYLMNAPASLKGLPAICLTGSQTEVFYNPNGIMAITSTYNNMLGHGMAYERPVSMEYIKFADGTEFQEDCGIRVHGSAWQRPRYQTPPVSGQWYGDSKCSLRLYFRSRYGEGKFKHSILEKFPEVDEMDNFVLRAGHNDQTNPFVRDEMTRRMQYRMSNQAARGTFVNVYVNGDYKGYFNLCERISEDYCQQWFDSDKEWDVVGWCVPASGSAYLEARDGDMDAFNAFINYVASNNLTNPLLYAEVERQMDMPAFVDYLIAQTWGGNWDWPQNNWTAAAERSTERKWRFFVWDAEGCMDGDYYRNRFNDLNYYDSSGLSILYRALKVNEDFKTLFADRLQKHFLDAGGAMTQSNLNAMFWELAAEVQSVIPSISTWISSTYIPQRESIFLSQCANEGLLAYAAPRIFLDGAEIQNEYAFAGSTLTMQNASGVSGDIYYTLDGSDPRLSMLERMDSTIILVAENAPKKVLVPTSDIGTTWRQLAYEDSSWNDGQPVDNTKTGGVGYERNPGELTSNVPYISYNVESSMYNQRYGAYIRIPFMVDGAKLSSWSYLTLKMRYDDGFVVYLNGQRVCYLNTFGTPSWNSAAIKEHENSTMETFDLSGYLGYLVPGQNLLAIHGLNKPIDSSDFVISAYLEAGFTPSSQGISWAAQKYTTPVTLQKSSRIKARTLNGSTWSALHEAHVSIGPIRENLRISEFMYHPNGDPNEEFVELTNIGTETLNLNKAAFTNGIDYTFGDTLLLPGQFILLVRNRNVFENRYEAGLPIAGEFAGALDNAGEKLQLSDALGNPFQTVDYKDGWFEITDGNGFSMTAVDPAYEKIGISTNLAARWTFNEASGTTVYDATDAYPGTIFNMTNTSRVYGPEGKALFFDGVDDYVEMTGYKGITGMQSRTCTAWVKTRRPSTSFILNWGSTSQAGALWQMRLNDDGTLRTGVNNGYLSGVTPIADGNWHHVAITLIDDGSPDISEAVLYVDGKPETAISSMLACPVNTAMQENVRIGTNITLTSFFEGTIDDVRVYSRALSADEIAAMAGVCWSNKDLWRPSAVNGGTPGRAETAQEQLPLPGSIVINELLAHSHSDASDWIELYNTTDQSIAIGGWFISDSAEVPRKFQIPAGVILTPSNPYYVIEETRFNNASDPACRVAFALSEGGETLYVQSAQGDELTGYLVQEEFDASDSDVSFGRYQKSIGGWNFVPMSSQTKGTANAYPKVGPIIMTEIMYNPGSATADKDAEYIELINSSDQPVRTASYVSTYITADISYDEWIPWMFDDGIVFEFPVDMWIAPGERILLVKDLAAFNSKYTGVPAGTVILVWGGSLDNAGEKVQLSMPGDKEFGIERYYIRHDRVNYDDEGDWPVAADGTGKSLTHSRPLELNNNYTNDAGNWIAANPTPGW